MKMIKSKYAVVVLLALLLSGAVYHSIIVSSQSASISSLRSLVASMEEGDVSASYVVSRVVDGDTIKVMTGAGEKTVRIMGIDTPETVHPRKPIECYGPEASAEARRLLDGTRVVLSTDSSGDTVDRYSRLLRYVEMADGSSYGEYMVSAGFARAYRRAKYSSRGYYISLEEEAKKSGRGLWSVCL